QIDLASLDPNVDLPPPVRMGTTGRPKYQSGIASLLPGRRPATVLRRVVAVIVAAVERMGARGARAPVGEERHEIVAPAVADLDAAAAVAGKIAVVRLAAPADHAVPALVFRLRKWTPGTSPELLAHCTAPDGSRLANAAACAIHN